MKDNKWDWVHRTSLGHNTKKKLDTMRCDMWDLYNKRVRENHGTARYELEWGDQRDSYKGVGENSGSRYSMIKLLFDEFFAVYGEYAVLHVSTYDYFADWQKDDDIATRLKWTNKNLFAERRTGFIFTNEQHVVNIRLDENDNIIIRETQRHTVTEEFLKFLVDSGIFGDAKVVFDDNTPQQIHGGCTALAMISALCTDDIYPNNDDANEFKMDFFQNIYNKLIESGKHPVDLASDEWRHYRMNLFEPFEFGPAKIPHHDRICVKWNKEEEINKLEDEYRDFLLLHAEREWDKKQDTAPAWYKVGISDGWFEDEIDDYAQQYEEEMHVSRRVHNR